MAVGQFVVYRTLLEETAPERELYLAIGSKTYESFFVRPSVQLVLKKNDIKLLVVNLSAEEVREWTS